MRPIEKAFLLALVALLAASPPADAQIAKGNVYGIVRDESGAVLPGAAVTVAGGLGTRSTVTDSSGSFRFLNLDQGTHTLRVSLSGFGSVERSVVVSTGRNVDLEFALKVATVEEAITVTADTPVVDTKKVGTSTVVTREELSRIPSSRDPWALMRTIPGVLVDRVNVAGSESGQQSIFTSKGSDPKDAVWAMDGVPITDMAAIGASPTYFTYDSFDEVDFATGGNSVTVATGGLGINVAPKRGTNAFHGSVGGYFTHDDLQSSNLPDELAGDPRLKGSDKADHTEQIGDWSVDLGGPVIRDRLWFYGSYGRNDIRIKRLDQSRDKTLLTNYTAKLNWQASANDMVSVFWFLGSKEKIGRVGAAGALQHLDGTQWDQGGLYPRHPHGLTKLEWNHVFSPSFFLDFKGSYYSTGFTLFPQGGLDDSLWVIDNVNQVAQGTSDARNFERPQTHLGLDGSYFFTGMGGNHELKFGGSWRDTDSTSERINPGDKAQARFNATSTRARFWRDALSATEGRYLSAYVSDVFTRDRLTLNVGLRFDHQTSRKLPSDIPGNPLIPTLLPALNYAGDSEPPVAWNDFSPRVGLTLALDDSRKTMARASYARYAGQLATPSAGWNNPVGSSFLEYDWQDVSGDRIVQTGEVDFSRIRSLLNVDPADPGGVAESTYQIDPDFKANVDHEVIVGLDRELAPNLAASVAYTWRRSTDFTATQLLSAYYWYSWIGVNRSDYGPGETFCAHGFCATPSFLSEAVFDRPEVTGGALLTNRPDFERSYSGLELSLVKRLSNRWMGRLAFTYQDWTEDVGPGAAPGSNPTHTDKDPQIDGGQVVYYSAGSGKVYYQNAKWQLAANLLYQLPADFEVAASVFGRQGYPNPIYATLDSGVLDGFVLALADGTEVDTQRFPDLWDVDLRLAKSLRLGGASRIVLSAEVFNVFNANTELKRINDFSSAAYGRLDEVLAPRIVRFGARFTF